MDKETTGKLITKTFQDSFNKESFVHFIKNLLNHIQPAHFIYRGNSIPDAYKPYIKTLERIGKYQDKEDKKIDLLIVQLKKETSLERARTMQRNFIAWYLNGSRGDILKDAALVAFVAPNSDDWRFSLVKMDYRFDASGEKVKVKQELTPARRFSFLVGKNESSHTAQSSLTPILQDDENNPTLKDLEDAFSIEKVTKEFFEKYHGLFVKVKEALDEVVKKEQKIKQDFKKKNIDTGNFAKKLLGQIVFLYFLQKKGWFGVKRDKDWGTGPKDFLRGLFNKEYENYQNFFNDILEPLFYEALANERSDDFYSRFNCKIPFLNGGLFDPINHYDWIHTDILLPNNLFSNKTETKEGDVGAGILDIFDRYNFTVKEDEPLEKEVAVDPEMLGKVFENLLEVKDRKSKGAYYTPREIVHYMCQQSLINYLHTEVNQELKRHKAQPNQANLLGKPDAQQLKIDLKRKKAISKHDLETLIQFGETAVEHDSRILKKGKETKTYSFKLPQSIRNNAKLIDEKLEIIRVCDPAVGSGAFPVGMMNEIVRARNALTPYLSLRGALQACRATKQSRSIYDFKRHAIQNCLYGVDIDPGAVEIAKLRLWLSLVVDEADIKQIKPLPNLDYKIVCGNSLLSVEKNLFNANLFSKLEELKPLFFNETNTGKKQEYKKQIDDLINQITNGRKDFDFEIYFSEVFHDLPAEARRAKAGKKGFDVVIANPPYVKEYVNKSAFDGLRKSPYYQGKMDLWYMFACRGIDLVKGKGVVTFIAQNNWVTSYGASKIRDKIILDTQILSLLDFEDFKVFETAGIQTMVMMFRKNNSKKEYSFDYRRIISNKPVLGDIIDLLNKKKNQSCQYLQPLIDRKKILGKSLVFSDSETESVLNRIAQVSNFKLRAEEVANGIHHHHDRVNKNRKQKLGKKYKIGQGIFVVSNKEFKNLNLSQKEMALIKPSYTTHELKKWVANSENREWVIYTDSSFKDKERIKDYPQIKKHLDKFKKVITSDNKPYGLHRAREEYFFKGEKIISVRKCLEPSFTYVDFDSYVSATFYVIKTKRLDRKYLTGLLNSKLIAFWLKHKGKMQGKNFQIDKEPILEIPLIKPDEFAQKRIIEVVNKILAITKSNNYLQNPIKQAKVKEYEKRIDEMIYRLYGLSEKERRTVERV